MSLFSPTVLKLLLRMLSISDLSNINIVFHFKLFNNLPLSYSHFVLMNQNIPYPSIPLTLNPDIDDSRKASTNAVVGLTQVVAFMGLLDINDLECAIISHLHVGVAHSKVTVIPRCGSWWVITVIKFLLPGSFASKE